MILFLLFHLPVTCSFLELYYSFNSYRILLLFTLNVFASCCVHLVPNLTVSCITFLNVSLFLSRFEDGYV